MPRGFSYPGVRFGIVLTSPGTRSIGRPVQEHDGSDFSLPLWDMLSYGCIRFRRCSDVSLPLWDILYGGAASIDEAVRISLSPYGIPFVLPWKLTLKCGNSLRLASENSQLDGHLRVSTLGFFVAIPHEPVSLRVDAIRNRENRDSALPR